MLNFKELKVKSDRLNKEITLEGYECGNKTIVSTVSLRKFFASIREEYGVNYTEEEKVSTDSAGRPVYAYVKLILEDKSGFRSSYIGEATQESLESDVARKYPLITAHNRACSAAFIDYLRLEGKVYSDEEIPNASAEEDNITIPPINSEDANTTSTSEVADNVSIPSGVNSVPSAADMLGDDEEDTPNAIENADATETDETVAENTEEEMAYNDVETKTEVAQPSTEEVKKDEKASKDTKDEAPKDAEKEGNTEEYADPRYNENFYGPFENVKVGDIITSYLNGTADNKVSQLIANFKKNPAMIGSIPDKHIQELAKLIYNSCCKDEK